MDTTAYLTSQGWLGNGHALHHSGRGITKPIIIPQKIGVLGVGKKKHDAHADQWWARAFDDTLKGINATKDEATGKTEAIALGKGAEALKMAGAHGARWVGQRGLYGNFVRGEGLGGTLTPEDEADVSSDSRKRKRAQEDEEEEVRAGLKKEKKRKSKRDQGHVDASRSDVAKSVSVHYQGLLEESMTKEQRRQRRRERKERERGDASMNVPGIIEKSLGQGLAKPHTRKKKNNELRAIGKAHRMGSTDADEKAVRSNEENKSKVSKKKKKRREVSAENDG